MRLCCITNLYPSRSRPYYGSFVREFMWALTRQSVQCTVVCPETVFSMRHGKLDPYETLDRTDSGQVVRVLRPRYVSASAKQLPGFNTDVISQFTFELAVRRTFVLLEHETDIIYGHFFYPAGRAAVQLGRAYGKPSVVRHGEGRLNARHLKRVAGDFADISGVISNSRRLKRYCEQELGIPGERVRAFLNGVDRSIFYPRDRVSMRRKLRLPQDQFLVIFVGYFTELKGPHRVLKAIETLDGVSAVLVGAPQRPDHIELESPRAVFVGAVEHSRLPEYMSAADAFVLPTTMEGCCNAILEAMACGIPVVSSNGDFNDEIIDDEVAIRVDPEDTDQIRQAILTLKESPGLRERLSKTCLIRSRQFDINTRAREVAEWLGEIVARNGGRARQCGSAPEGA